MAGKDKTLGGKQLKLGLAGGRRVLEPRVLFDAAMATTYAEVTSDTSATDVPAPDNLLVALADLPAEPATAVSEVVFVDGRIENADVYAQSLQEAGRAVYLLDSSSDGLEQISRLLSAYDNLSSIHIVSHGADGALTLGADQVTSSTLTAQAGRLAAIGSALSENGDILLYGCDVAKTAVGEEFVRQLSALTGADVAASVDATGSTGDWSLEHQSGVVEAAVPDLIRNYQGDLALVGIGAGTPSTDSGDAASYQQGKYLDGSGEWVVSGQETGGVVKVWQIVGNTRTEYDIVKPSGTANVGGSAVVWSPNGFGHGVAISGDTMIVVDPDATFTQNNAGGAVTNGKGVIAIYQLNTALTGNPWVHVKTVKIENGTSTNSGIGPWNSYGSHQFVAIDGNHIVIGAPNEGSGTGRVYWVAATAQDATTGKWIWSTVQQGFFDEPTLGASNATPYFGASVDVAKDGIIVGAPEWDINNDDTDAWDWTDDNNHGRVFIYEWVAGTSAGPTNGNAITKTLDGGGVADARLGSAVAMEFNAGTYTYVMGAPTEDSDNGEVYLYQTTSASLTATGAFSNIYQPLLYDVDGRFGSTVSVSQARMLIGSSNNSDATKASVWYFEDADGVWTGLNASGLGNMAYTPNGRVYYSSTNFVSSGLSYAAADRMGYSVAFTLGNFAVFSAPFADKGFTDNGQVTFRYIRTPVAVKDAWDIEENPGATDFNSPTVSVSLDILNNDVFAGEFPGANFTGDTTGTLASGTAVTVTLQSSTQLGAGNFIWNNSTRRLEYNPNNAFEYLSEGETATVTIRYKLTSQVGATFESQGVVTLTIRGENDRPQVDAGIPNVAVPKTNEPAGNPNGAPISTGSIAILANAFKDIDRLDVLTYSLVSVTNVGLSPALTPAQQAAFIQVTGSGASGAINYNLAGVTANSVYTVTVRATDNASTTPKYVETTFTFTIARTNENPEISTTPVADFSTAEDAVLSRDISSGFRDPDPAVTTDNAATQVDERTYSERLTYSIVSQTGPGTDWLSISSSGVLGGVATNPNVGVHTVVVRATDVFGNWIEDTFVVSVTNTNDAPVLVNAIPRKEAIRGETFSFTLGTGAVAWGGGSNPPADTSLPYFTDIDNSTADGRSPSSGDVITYKAFDALTGEEITGTTGGTGSASWLRFNSATGVFSGTPPTTQPLGTILTIRLEATDRIGGAAGPIGGTTATLFEIGVFPRDGSAPVGALPALENGGQLGFDVAINSDSGEWAVVGEPGGNGGNGTIWIYRNANFADSNLAPSWALAGGVPAAGFTTTAADARLGIAVDISADGTKIVAGAPFENNRQGAVYYLSRTGSGAAATWALSATKGVSPDAANDDRFGSAVAINENGAYVLVGAPTDDEAGINAGAAYMYAFGAATGSGKRLPTFDTGESGVARAGDLYGSAVAFDQNMLVVGAQRDDHSGKTDAGSVYVYSTDNTEFVKLKKDPLVNPVGTADYFGASVDVESFAGRNSVVVVVGAANDNRLATGAGAVYVFRSDTMTTDNTNGGGLTSLAQQAVITAYKGGALKSFGTSVAVDVAGDALAGDLRIAVGAEINAASPGAVYAYKYKSGTGWVGQRYLAGTSAGTVNAGNAFGSAVDIAGAWFIGGSPKAEDSALSMAGRYYSFSVLTGTPDSPIELSGQIAKVVDDEVPPVVWNPPASGTGATGTSTGMGSSSMTGSSFASMLAGLGDSSTDWKKLLKPVNSWSPTSELAMPDFAAGAQTLASKGENYSEALLFEQRTKPAVELLVRKGEISETSPEQAIPATEGQETEKAPADAAPAPGELLQGFSSQLDAVQASRAREAQRLLSSLSSLTS